MAAIWYIGRANVRSISAAAWAAAGIAGRADVSWDQTNGWSLPKAGFTQAQIDLLDADDEFNINGADGPRPGDAAIPNLTDTASRSWVQEQITGLEGEVSATYAPVTGSPNYTSPTQAAGLSAALSIVFGG